MKKQTLIHPYNEMLLSNKKQSTNDIPDNLSIFHEYYTQLKKKIQSQRVNIIQFHLHDVLEIIKLQKWRTDQQFPKDKEGGGSGGYNYKIVVHIVPLW